MSGLQAIQQPHRNSGSGEDAGAPIQSVDQHAGRTFGAGQGLKPGEAKARRATESKHLITAFGEIVSVLMRTQQFRSIPLSNIESVVVPALLTGQFVVARAQSNHNGFVTPVAAMLWASVSAEVDSRLSVLDQPLRLAPNEWKCGDIPWLVLVAGEDRVIGPLLKQFQQKALKGRPLKMRVKGKEGKETVRTLKLAPQGTQTGESPGG